jgi:ABC-type branched-subunit amino acid transport system substrate-binding protein
MAAAAVAKTQKIPLISYASTSPEVTGFADDGYLFRVVPSDAFQGGAMADIAEKGGYTTAVVVHLDNAYGTGVKNAFESAFTGEVVKSIAYDPATIVATSLVDQVAAEDPDVVIAVSYATDGSKLFVQMADQGLNVPVIGGDGVADDAIFDELNGTQDAMMNLVATKPTAVSSASVTAFETAYAAAGYSGGIYTGEAFDAVWVGVLAAVAADSNDGEAIRDAIYDIDYNGGSGKKVFDANGDINTAAYLVMEVQDAGFTEVGTWVDGTLTLNEGFTQQAAVQGAPFPVFGLFAGIAVIAIVRRRK